MRQTPTQLRVLFKVVTSHLAIKHGGNADELEEEEQIDHPSQREVLRLGFVVGIVRRQ